MFVEPKITGEKRGWIEVICGSMFSGKTEELIRRVKRAKIANLQVEIFKHAADARYHENNVMSHDSNSVVAFAVSQSDSVLQMAKEADIVGIDEAQFFDEGIIHVCETLALKGVRVIIAGLDMDYLGKPFGSMPQLLAIADYITKLHAVCVKCGNIANVSYRKTKQEGQVIIGEKDLYEPRCRECYYKG